MRGVNVVNDAAIHLTYGTYPTGLPRGLRPLAMTVDVYGYDTYFCHAELVSASGRHYVLSVTLDRSRNEVGMTIGKCPQYLIGRIRHPPPPPVQIITFLVFINFSILSPRAARVLCVNLTIMDLLPYSLCNMLYN